MGLYTFFCTVFTLLPILAGVYCSAKSVLAGSESEKSYIIPYGRKYYTMTLKLIQQPIKHQLLPGSCFEGKKNPFKIFKS
jgi:hypothetical protein